MGGGGGGGSRAQRVWEGSMPGGREGQEDIPLTLLGVGGI